MGSRSGDFAVSSADFAVFEDFVKHVGERGGSVARGVLRVLEGASEVRNLIVALAGSAEFVGDVEGREDGDAEAVDGVRSDVHVVQSMLDRLAFMYLVHTPDVQKAQREAALVSGTRRHASWRRAVTQMARDGSLDSDLTRPDGNKPGA